MEQQGRSAGRTALSADGWDASYRDPARPWSVRPNATLDLIAELTAGRALDVGCGEGADARWLAAHGWEVIAVDFAQAALDGAALVDPAARVEWVHCDLTAAPPPGGPVDLVAAHYFPIEIGRIDVVEWLIGALAPGGTLLFVAHDPADIRGHGFDPAQWVQPADIADRFGQLLDVELLGRVARGDAVGGVVGRRHTHNAVLLARRR